MESKCKVKGKTASENGVERAMVPSPVKVDVEKPKELSPVNANAKEPMKLSPVKADAEKPKVLCPIIADAEKSKELFPANKAVCEQKIVKQLEFYFSDFNLPYDKFLLNKTKIDHGWVEISVLLNFKRLAAITTDTELITSAIKNAPDSILEIDEANKKIRRKPDITVPVINDEFLNKLIDRSVYCDGFPKTATMNELLEFAAEFGDNVITKVTLQRHKTNEFKGSLYFTFNSKEEAEKFLNRESIEYNGVQLFCQWKKDFLEENKKKYEQKVAKRDEKVRADTDKYCKKGFLLKANNLDSSATIESVKAVCIEFDWQVAYVKIVNNERIAWIRLKPVIAAKDVLEQTKDKKNSLNLNFSVPDEETEQGILNQMAKEIKSVRSMKDKIKKEKYRNKGQKRFDNKRRNNEGYSSYKLTNNLF